MKNESRAQPHLSQQGEALLAEGENGLVERRLVGHGGVELALLLVAAALQCGGALLQVLELARLARAAALRTLPVRLPPANVIAVSGPPLALCCAL